MNASTTIHASATLLPDDKIEILVKEMGVEILRASLSVPAAHYLTQALTTAVRDAIKAP